MKQLPHIHEAGHVVHAIYCGGEVDWIRLYPDSQPGESAGQTCLWVHETCQSENLCAGSAAEMLSHRPRRNGTPTPYKRYPYTRLLMTTGWGRGTDYQRAFRCYGAERDPFRYTEIDKLIARDWLAANRLLSDNWGDVVIVAAALEQRGELSHDDLETLLSPQKVA